MNAGIVKRNLAAAVFVAAVALLSFVDPALAQLKAYDVGRLQPNTAYAGRYPEQQPVDGAPIPTFKEVITDRTLILSFDWRNFARIQPPRR